MKRYLKKVVFCTEEPADLFGLTDHCSEDILYIVDTKRDLERIKSMGLPVLAWLHELNKEEDLSGAAYAVEEPKALDMDFYEKVYRREKNIPWEILETERLLIREMIPEDATAFEAIYEEPSIRRYMKDFHRDAEGEAEYIREYQAQYRFYEYGVWSIVLKESGQVIGRAGFSDMQELSYVVQEELQGVMANESIPCFGYMIGVPWQRQGYAEEAGRAILDYAREELGFTTVWLQVEEENEASLRLAKKLGFEDAEMGCQVFKKVL